MKESHAKRLADLSTYGDSQLYLFALLILGTAVVGSSGGPWATPAKRRVLGVA